MNKKNQPYKIVLCRNRNRLTIQKKNIKDNVAELKEMLNKLAKSYNEAMELLKQAKEWLEKE